MLNHTIKKRQLVKFGIVLSLLMISANELAAADDHHDRHHTQISFTHRMRLSSVKK